MSAAVIGIFNPTLAHDAEDVLYHFGLVRSALNMPEAFGDVKFVCTGGSASRLTRYAEIFAAEMNAPLSANLSRSDRYCMFKTGPVLWINHGMGAPSLSIMLIETIKLLHYAGCSDVIFFRLGTSGGLGVDPGTVLISNGALNGSLEESHVQYIMGEKVLRPAILDQDLVQELYDLGKELVMPVETGKTMCADDFYEGQARTDGAFCEYTDKDKLAFIARLYGLGVRNIEMESTCFAGLLHRAGIKGAIVCVTIINRLNGDQVTTTKAQIQDFELRPLRLFTAFVRKHLQTMTDGLVDKANGNCR